ncbi:Uncharacterised protein [Yersinia frederiksenii]|nr:Uncharacterised protein [Yersinia frederiksenii]
MNNIEQIIVRLKTRVALAELIGPDVTVSASDLSALIAQLEAVQKSNAFLKEQMAQLANFNPDWDKLEACQDSWRELSALQKETLHRAEKAEAALSAANEKLSKPVVLPPRRSASSFVDEEFSNKDLAAIYNAARIEFSVKITNAGFTVEGG